MSAEFVHHDCGCGHVGRALVQHYDRVKCGGCGRAWWALRPKRNGPLVAFPWPGLPERVNHHKETFDYLRGVHQRRREEKDDPSFRSNGAHRGIPGD